MEKTTKEIKEKKYMEVDIYDTDGDGFIDVCTMALSLIDSETGDTLNFDAIKKQLEKLEGLIKSSDTTSENSEKLIKDLKTLQDKVENVERTLDSKIISNKIEQTEQIEQVKDLIINIQNVISTKADKIHMHDEYANKTHTHNYNDLINKPTIPTKTSELNNDSEFVTKTEINEFNNKLTLFNATCTYDTNYKVTIENNPTLPNYFTLRFKAPNNYIEGKTFNINSNIYTPKNANFETDDIVSVEFDKVNKKCFFKVGGGIINETLPPQVRNVTCENGNKKLTLSWNIDDITYLDGYVVTMKENSIPQSVNDGVKYNIGKTLNTYTFDNLINGNTYYSRVYPYNSKKQYQTIYNYVKGLPLEALRLKDLPVGSLIKFGKYQVESEPAQPIIWKIIDNNNHYRDENNSGIEDHVTLLTEKIIDLRAFDAVEKNKQFSTGNDYSNNRYLHSNIRQWLNKSEKNWFIKQHIDDRPPTNAYTSENTQYSDKYGFLNSFTQGEIDKIVSTKLVVKIDKFFGGGSEIVNDKVFLLSGVEVGLENKIKINEGKQFNIFNSDSSRQTGVTEQCIKNNKNNFSSISSWQWWLRTPNNELWWAADCVSPYGKRHRNWGDIGNIGLRPAINVSSDILVPITLDANGCYSIIL